MTYITVLMRRSQEIVRSSRGHTETRVAQGQSRRFLCLVCLFLVPDVCYGQSLAQYTSTYANRRVFIQIVACGVVGGMDLAALFPRWFTIRRGSFVIAAIGICINPWRILNVSNVAELY